MPARVVGDISVRYPVTAELPRRQSALVARPRFVNPDMQRDTCIMGVIHRRRCGAPIDGRDPASVTVGQQAHGFAAGFLGRDILDKLQTVQPNLAIDLNIFVRNIVGEGQCHPCPVHLRQRQQYSLATVQRPTQIDRGGAGVVQKSPR